MTRKILLIALLFIFMLSACAPATQTSEVSETSEVLTPTSTFTPEPTATQTPIPTATPILYTSCLAPELLAGIDEEFLEKTGVDSVTAFQQLLDKGLHFKTGVLLRGDSRSYWTMYEGYEVVNIDNDSVKQLVCMYHRHGDNGEKQNATIVAWVDEARKFHPMVEFSDRRNRPDPSDWTSFQPERFKPKNLSEVTKFLDSLSLGVGSFEQMHVFRSDILIDDIESSSKGTPEHAEYVKAFLRALGYSGELTDEIIEKLSELGQIPSQPRSIVEPSLVQ